MVTDQAVSLPTPESTDSDDVRLALDAAARLWAAGDVRDALRWLGRAAQSASDADDDLRSVQLARAAADLKTQFDISSVVPPADSSTGRGSMPSVPPASAAASESSPAGRGSMPSSPATSAASAAPATTASSSIPQPAAPSVAVAPRPAATPQRGASSDPVLRPASMPDDVGSVPPVVRHSTMRVQVLPTRNPDGSFLVRPLADGELAQPDARVALLVSIRPDLDPLPL